MTEDLLPAGSGTRPQTKAATVQKLLARPKGATLAELTDATAWQPHSTRALRRWWILRRIDGAPRPPTTAGRC